MDKDNNFKIILPCGGFKQKSGVLFGGEAEFQQYFMSIYERILETSYIDIVLEY